MGRKLTFKDVKDRLREINPNIDIVSDEYKNTDTRVVCRCKIDGCNWDATVTSLLHQKSGCPKCAGVVKYSIEERNDILSKNDSKIKIIDEHYNKATKRTMCNCICKECGHAFESNWANLNAGRGCPKCARKLITKEERQEILYKNGINATILSVYSKHRGKAAITKSTYCKCKCNIDGHIWEGLWSNLNKGAGCPKCAGVVMFTLEDIQKFVDNNNMNIITLSKEIKGIKGHTRSFVKCKCKKDGYVWWSQLNNLTELKGCPVCSGSNLEKITQEILSSKNIEYYREYRFDECRNKYPLPFDFYLSSYNTVIELDGEQHYKPIQFGGMSYDKAKKCHKERKINDEIKNKFCKDNKINLIRIPYYKIKDIENIIDKATTNS